MGTKAKRKPVVGIIANVHVVENRFPAQMVGERNLRAVADVTGALPLMFAGTPEITDIGALMVGLMLIILFPEISLFLPRFAGAIR